jgi:adenylate cyclase
VKRQLTKGTELAALEASRNEQQVLAEGALLGERRVAWARLAMVAMFGVIANVEHKGSRAMIIVGSSYSVFAIVTLWRLHRTTATMRSARWIPVVFASIDFAFSTTQGLLSIHHSGTISAGEPAIATAILMSFAIARSPVHHVAYSTLLGIVSFSTITSYAGELRTATPLFVLGGLVVLGFMILMTNIAVRRMFAELRKRDNLTRFLPRQVAERVLAHGAGSLAPVEREVTVLFSDIRGFTGISEGMAPRALLMMLDDYFGRMTQIVKGHDGVVGKFIGDGLLAFWGVPDRLDDHAVHAVRAARDMRKALVELNEFRARDGLVPLRVGIGIHTGPVAAGMLGGALQAEYTIIGDAVNVASRVEGLTKEHQVDVLVSETTWAQLPEPRRGERRAAAEIRGRKEPVVVYTLDP